jgi:hypothetical protein
VANTLIRTKKKWKLQFRRRRELVWKKKADAANKAKKVSAVNKMKKSNAKKEFLLLLPTQMKTMKWVVAMLMPMPPTSTPLSLAQHGATRCT